MRRATVFILAICLSSGVFAQDTTPPPSARLEVPKVLSTSPQFWAVGVNPARQKSIEVTFDQPMRGGFTAWLGRSSVLPELNLDDEISEDLKTFRLRVDLESAKVYVFALNEKGIPGVGFQTGNGVSARPHYLVFQTTGTPKPEEAPPRAVKTEPAHAAQTVNPAKTTGIVITFDKPMQTKKHGLHLFESDKPVDLSKAQFTYSPDGTVFSIGYNFKPSTKYRVEMNNINDIGFASAQRIPMWPVKFQFATTEPQE